MRCLYALQESFASKFNLYVSPFLGTMMNELERRDLIKAREGKKKVMEYVVESGKRGGMGQEVWTGGYESGDGKMGAVRYQHFSELGPEPGHHTEQSVLPTEARARSVGPGRCLP